MRGQEARPVTTSAHMRDITNPKLLYLKGMLFLACGAVAAGLIILDSPTLKTAALLAVAVWCFARAYYFAFYVIERYADPTFRYAGLGSLLAYLLRRRATPVDLHLPRDHGTAGRETGAQKPGPP